MELFTKATAAAAPLKILGWGAPGTGKTRFALSFPNPYVVDLEKGSRLYAADFDFQVAELGKVRKDGRALGPSQLVTAVIEAVETGAIKPGTLILDSITDWLDDLEALLMAAAPVDWGKLSGGQLHQQKRAHVKDPMEARIRRLLALDCHVVLLSRSKNLWGTNSNGQLSVIGKTPDSNELAQWLTDATFEFKGGGVIACPKSRFGLLPKEFHAPTFEDFQAVLAQARTQQAPGASPEKGGKK